MNEKGVIKKLRRFLIKNKVEVLNRSSDRGAYSRINREEFLKGFEEYLKKD